MFDELKVRRSLPPKEPWPVSVDTRHLVDETFEITDSQPWSPHLSVGFVRG